jgi:hypothetical protein
MAVLDRGSSALLQALLAASPRLANARIWERAARTRAALAVVEGVRRRHLHQIRTNRPGSRCLGDPEDDGAMR